MPITPEKILAEYRRGRFPMADPYDGRIDWCDPDPRGILPLDTLHVPRRLRRYMNKFQFSIDRDFEAVIDACARPVTWISPEIRDAYVELHRLGHAHSVEAADGGRLAGGIYGVRIGGAFMAESMFHALSNASGACLVTLAERLRARGFALLDIQQVLPATARYGAVAVSRADYRRRLADAVKLAPPWNC